MAVNVLAQTVGANIRDFRKRRGVSQSKLSIDCELFQSQLWRIENGEHLPSIKTLEKICFYLGVSSVDILGF